MKTIRIATGLASLLAIGLLSGCEQEASQPVAAEAQPAVTEAAEPTVSVYAAAVANTLRPDDDRTRDEGRKPAQVLEFIGIKPGMAVLDMYSGGGWYAEVIAHVVGESGKVIAQTNLAYKGFVGDALEDRFDSGRVPQAEILMAENNHLVLEADSLDAVIMAQSFHDLYHMDVDNGWELVDAPAFLAELRKGLKPGGIVGIIDHTAAAGSPPETGDTLHRIDPELVKERMLAAGFVFDGESDILHNDEDDLTKIVFAPDIRGKTDRFVMRFSNPE